MIIAVNHNANNTTDYVLDMGTVVRVRTSKVNHLNVHVKVLDITGVEPRVYACASVGTDRVVCTHEFAVRTALSNLVADVCVCYKGNERDTLIAAITEVMDFIG